MPNRIVKPRSLQARISLTLFGFAVVVALLVSTVGNFINEKIELAIWEETLSSELEFQLQRKHSDPHFVPERRESLRTYSRALGLEDSGDVPVEFRSLSPGIHDEFEFRGRQVCILVRDINSVRYYLTYDITDLEDTEYAWTVATIIAVAFIAVLVLLFSLQLGRWLVAPIEDLAARVSSLHPDALETALSPKYSQQEVKTIASALDRFIDRLNAFIRRERSFISMASHEFRTPLAVISGAVDVLTSQEDLPSRAKKPIERIRRSIQEMQEIIGALLFLANEQQSDDALEEEVCEVDQILPGLIESHMHLLRNKRLDLRIDFIEPTRIRAPRALVSIVVANLIRNAVQYTIAGEVVVCLSEGVVSVRDTGPGIAEKELQAASEEAGTFKAAERSQGHGLGLYIVRRISARFGWGFHLTNNVDGGSLASLAFAGSRIDELPMPSRIQTSPTVM